MSGLHHYPKNLEVSLSEKTKLGVGSSIMVSVSKDGHFQKHSTVEMGVALQCFIQISKIMPSLQVQHSK